MNFEPLRNTRILDAALGKPVDKIPVWIMRQAGRYLPEYMKLRSKYGFFEVCETPQLVMQVTLLPFQYFDLDAAIIFSDVLVVPKAMGLHTEIHLDRGVEISNIIKTPEDIDKLITYPINVYEKLKYVFDAITLTRQELRGNVPLLGFSGAPWTLMCSMTETTKNSTKPTSRIWPYKYPQASHRLLQMLTQVVIDYLVGQIEAGAQMVQLFEFQSKHLSKYVFDEFCLPYIRKISSSVREKLKEKGVAEVPMIVSVGGVQHSLKELATSGYEVISIDWIIDPEEAREIVGTGVTLQGNLDPWALHASSEDVARFTKTMVDKFGRNRYIANLGHGMLKDINPEQVKTFVDTVHSL